LISFFLGGRAAVVASEEFKAKIKAGEIFEALTLAMSQAIELEITTWVGSSATIINDSPPQPGSRIRTRMNLLNGQMENEVGSQFIGNGPYQELQKFHQAQVKQGCQMILQNLESLQKMFVVLNRTRSLLPQEHPPTKPVLDQNDNLLVK